MGLAKDDFQFAEQERWWRRAIDADPELGWALSRYAKLLRTVGRIGEAIDMGLRAQLHRRMADSTFADLLASTGELQEAKHQYELIRPMDPEQVDQAEMQTEVLYGNIETAAKKLRERPTLAGEQLECWRQLLAARRGERLNTARLAKACGDSGGYSARAFALAGDLDAAYRAIDLALKSGERFVPNLFEPELHSFRRDRRFWPLAARMGLVDYWLDTGQWPDFCSEPNLPFDCKTEAAKARLVRAPVRDRQTQ
jgi:tetratricopeptide (TPR) repeat protein